MLTPLDNLPDESYLLLQLFDYNNDIDKNNNKPVVLKSSLKFQKINFKSGQDILFLTNEDSDHSYVNIDLCIYNNY